MAAGYRSILAVAVVLAVLPLFVQSNFVMNFLVMTLMFAFLGQGWNVLGGYAGQFSFGHAVFFGTGAYVTAIETGADWPSSRTQRSLVFIRDLTSEHRLEQMRAEQPDADAFGQALDGLDHPGKRGLRPLRRERRLLIRQAGLPYCGRVLTLR